jgi:anti-anti-sigma factor
MLFKITIKKIREGAYVVSPNGSIDIESSMVLEKETEKALIPSTKALILDMSGVDYIGSMGVRAIMGMRKRIEDFGGAFIITGLQPQVKKIFDILHIFKVMTVFDSVEDAEGFLAATEK